MVWIAEQSPLYKSVEEFNNSPREEASASERDCTPEQECGCNSESERGCEKKEEQPKSFPPPQRRTPSGGSFGNILQKVTGDRDFMLIAALIILLLHEKADMKLIAALAFVLLT